MIASEQGNREGLPLPIRPAVALSTPIPSRATAIDRPVPIAGCSLVGDHEWIGTIAGGCSAHQR
ncbi:MAG TPA: hypothetical protein VKY19_00780 [Ktedonosporobacter sp.]|nr:hypothetical protein [Ktedonosporobacter sp.]